MFPWWIPESNISATSRERERKQRGEARGLERGQTPLIRDMGTGLFVIWGLPLQMDRAVDSEGAALGMRFSMRRKIPPKWAALSAVRDSKKTVILAPWSLFLLFPLPGPAQLGAETVSFST